MRRSTFRFPITTLAGSTLKNNRAILSNHVVEPKYRTRNTLTLIVSGILEIFNATERFFWQKRIKNHRLEMPPVFIIGFWRNGTTMLHNLLCQDPQAAYVTTFQTVFPNLILTQSWWLKHLLNIFIPPNRPYDNVSMDVDFPQEEDFGLMNIQPASIYKFFLFPKDFDRIVEEELFTGNLPPEIVSQWMEAYRSMIAKAVFNTGGRCYIGKNPCHLARLGLLREMYPDAKFIFIHRHPYKVAESFYHFFLSIFESIQLQDVPPAFTRETIARLYQSLMNTYLHDRQLIPAENLIELQFDDFAMDVPGQMQEIYRKFGLGDYSKVAARIEKYLDENPGPGRIPNSPTPDTIRYINQYAGEIMKEFGYEKT